MRASCGLKSVFFSLLCVLSLCAVCEEKVSDYPSKAVKIIVTFTPGGAADVTARIFAEKLASLWKQGVIVENKAGAGGSIGAESVFRSPADGYTLLLATNTHIINQVLIPKLAFDFTKDFVPLGLVTSAPMLIAVNPQLKVHNLQELTKLIKAEPGKHAYAACNMASPHYFAMAIYMSTMKLEATNIPYKGCTPAVADTLGGQVNIVAASIPAVVSFIKQGTLQPIALLSSKPSPALPGVPTAGESGIADLKNFSLDNYYGFMAPMGTPVSLQKKLEDDIKSIALLMDTKSRLEVAGLEPFVLSSTEMMKLIRSDEQKYAQAAKQSNIKAE
ncbi:MAG: tripartite tricarboxylate transporter substrate-binding protein [Betaproteobacteria bacterium]|jgi:tripartite-type tricarboxylate transporter receptor subunit TctC